MDMNELLKNNGKDMATVVETFLIEETAELIYDNEQLEKWNKHVEELGLVGQTQIVKKDKSPIPFMHMKTNLKCVFETLCPRKVDAKEYNITPIPIEILDLMALSMREGYFDKVQIWYDDKNPDPACIGLKGQWYSYKQVNNFGNIFNSRKEAEQESLDLIGELKAYFVEWNSEHYLLGKWADVKHSFAELTAMATERFKQEKGHEYRNAIKTAQRGLDDLESEAFEKFGTNVNGHDNGDLPF